MIVEPIEDGETLQSLLLRGDIDAVLAPNPRKLFSTAILRFYVLSEISVLLSAYQKNWVFPIMHMIVSIVDVTLTSSCAIECFH